MCDDCAAWPRALLVSDETAAANGTACAKRAQIWGSNARRRAASADDGALIADARTIMHPCLLTHEFLMVAIGRRHALTHSQKQVMLFQLRFPRYISSERTAGSVVYTKNSCMHI
jgi:hypothetical protein